MRQYPIVLRGAISVIVNDGEFMPCEQFHVFVGLRYRSSGSYVLERLLCALAFGNVIASGLQPPDEEREIAPEHRLERVRFVNDDR